MPSRSYKSWISSTFLPNPTLGTAPWPDIQWGNQLNPECCVNLIAVGIWNLLVMNQLSHWCPNEGWEGVIPPTGSDEGQQCTGTDGLRKENLELSPFHLQDSQLFSTSLCPAQFVDILIILREIIAWEYFVQRTATCLKVFKTRLNGARSHLV